MKHCEMYKGLWNNIHIKIAVPFDGLHKLSH